jgi:uncharacterized coiled-coil protein SlyX
VDNNTLISLLGLIVLVVGCLVGVLWSRLNEQGKTISELSQALVNERVHIASQYITAVEMDRRLEQAIKPVEKMLEKIEDQNKQIFAAITHGKRMSDA